MPGLLQLGQVSLALAILYVVYLIIKQIQQRQRREPAVIVAPQPQLGPRGEENGRSGEKSVSYWKREISDAVKEGVSDGLRDRTEELRDLFKEVLEPIEQRQKDIEEKQNVILRDLAIIKERRGFPRS